MALLYQPGQAHERHHLGQQFFERRVVQQRARAQAAPARQGPAQRHQREPARTAAHHRERVGAIHLVRMELAPYAGDAAHGAVEIISAAGQRGGVDGPRRRARDDGERIGFATRTARLAQVGNGLQHAHLVGGPRPAPGKQQARAG